uniref:Auxin-responsive protein n=1 Tax=Physcomitrium patens TaxID=3218 RepID=Q948Q2_PHYPA|nr:PpIAA1a [Physcomitrium patens]BAB71765.1 IAA/AUX protein [Physcomitrium patens]
MNVSEGCSTLTGAQLKYSTDKSNMSYETVYRDAAVESPQREVSNESGSTLKEHDYFGLSEVLSSNSSSGKQPEKCCREELNLNESATTLQLGPPAAVKPSGQADGDDAHDEGAGPENPAKRSAYHMQQESLADGRKAAAEMGSFKIQRKNILEEFRAMKAHAHMTKSPKTVQTMQHNMHVSYSGAQMAFGGAKNNGVKRVFSEAVVANHNAASGVGVGVREGNDDVSRCEEMNGTEQLDLKVHLPKGMGMARMAPASGSPSFDNMQGPLNPFFRKSLVSKMPVPDGGDSSANASNDCANRKGMVASPSVQPPPAQNQTVGWPPVKNFNKMNTPAPPASTPARACPSVQRKGASTSSSGNLVKIYMDGVPFGRKVDLKTNDSYDKLYSMLEDMFQQYISGQYCGGRSSSSGESHWVASSRKLNFLEGSEYVLIYEDHEGDSMLVGDVPWELFVNAVKRLRIMKGSEQVNLAPKNADPTKVQVAVG